MIILVFTSSALVPTETMPGRLEAFANVNPITVSVDALRALCLGRPNRDSRRESNRLECDHPRNHRSARQPPLPARDRCLTAARGGGGTATVVALRQGAPATSVGVLNGTLGRVALGKMP